jgi:hypothetical protein
MMQKYRHDLICRRAGNGFVDLFEHGRAQIAMRSEIRTVVWSGRIDANEKNAVMMFRAYALSIHPIAAGIFAGPIVIARNKREPPIAKQGCEYIEEQSEFRVCSFMGEIPRDDDVFNVVRDEPLDQRFRPIGGRTYVEVGQVSQTSMVHEQPS